MKDALLRYRMLSPVDKIWLILRLNAAERKRWWRILRTHRVPAVKGLSFQEVLQIIEAPNVHPDRKMLVKPDFLDEVLANEPEDVKKIFSAALKGDGSEMLGKGLHDHMLSWLEANFERRRVSNGFEERL